MCVLANICMSIWANIVFTNMRFNLKTILDTSIYHFFFIVNFSLNKLIAKPSKLKPIGFSSFFFSKNIQTIIDKSCHRSLVYFTYYFKTKVCFVSFIHTHKKKLKWTKNSIHFSLGSFDCSLIQFISQFKTKISWNHLSSGRIRTEGKNRNRTKKPKNRKIKKRLNSNIELVFRW